MTVRQDNSRLPVAGLLLLLGLTCIAFAIGFIHGWQSGLAAAGIEMVLLSVAIAASRH